MMVGAEKGFTSAKGLVLVRGASTGVCSQAQMVPPMELASPQAIIFKETTENSSSSTSRSCSSEVLTSGWKTLAH
jgi:hypothetical protein